MCAEFLKLLLKKLVNFSIFFDFFFKLQYITCLFSLDGVRDIHFSNNFDAYFNSKEADCWIHKTNLMLLQVKSPNS